ncbi:MAG: hypothetical protein QNI89_07855 [Desulfobacterales bacterium]|nr:hypothetical protein [Desulfobacterales bacterium]MDJ0855093.1 hypothetical protein [Desulfobacterales bacterium]MDJ0887196.1 hypothetical protein [Desulfobacterales bacterium]MDJ0988702.1 hypothetical protein [Desulfobacterales bacterium]
MRARPKPSQGVIFACPDRGQIGCFPIDNNMRKVLRQIDGHRSLASVAFAAGLTMTEMQETIRALVQMELIVPVESEFGKYHGETH